MKQILELLKAIDDANTKDVVTSIRFFSDGSGRIYESEEKEIAEFQTCKDAIAILTDILNIHLKSLKIK